MINLPEMTVEKRVSETAHGIPAPSEDRERQLEEAIELNHLANEGEAWGDRIFEILKDYSPIEFDRQEGKDAVRAVTGFRSWQEASEFVVDDMCSEFFNMALKYCLKTKQEHVSDEGFIDGSGIGYLKFYTDRLKVTLEQCFDAKYFYKQARPLEYSIKEKGIDLSNIANAIHPGHWAYPAGHGTKFICVVECLNKVFKLDDDCYRILLITAVLLAHGRSGNLIHFPEDNLAAIGLFELR